MDSRINKFYEFQKSKKKRNVIKPQIIQNIELINKLRSDGNSYLQIHEFLKQENVINCRYNYFMKVLKTIEGGEKQQSNKSNEKKESNEVVSNNNTERKSQSKTVDVSFKPITSLDDGITEEEMKELMEQQKRILNRRN